MHSDRVSTTGTESRKSSKPIMEKRRRARINASLAELKSLLLEVIKKEGARHSKMEKADILEMAVKHLRQIQRQQYTGGGSDPTLSDKYRLGFNECAQEVSRYLGAADHDDAELRARLLNHLANCITNSDSLSPLSTPSSSPAPSIHSGQVTSSTSGLEGNGSARTPLAPIPVRPASKPGLSFPSQGGVGGTSPSAALLLPTTEINNNIATFANNNNLISSAAGGVVGGVAGFRNLSHHVALATSTSPTTATAASVIGELQMLSPKSAGGEVAFVLPANVMSGGQLHSYIIPVYTASPGLPATTVTFAHSAGFPIMAPPHVSVAGSESNLVTLASGTHLSPAVLPPSSVGHVVATGLNASLTWHPAAAVYTSSSSNLQTNLPSPVNLVASPANGALNSMTSISLLNGGNSLPSSVKNSLKTELLLSPVAFAPDTSAADSIGPGPSHRPRLQADAGPLDAGDESLWRPW